MARHRSAEYLTKHVAVLRIAFGLMWAINAVFKWLPTFRSTFLNQVQGALDGQPDWLHGWFTFWIQLFSHNPNLFAVLVALSESLIALALIFGLARRTTYLAAALFSLLIWAIPEGFGGPYSASSTDIGTGIVYAIVFLSLYGLDRFAQRSYWSLDNCIVRKFPWWAVVANP